MNFWQRLKQKWHVSSDGQMVVIWIVFAITGSLSVRLADPVLRYVGIDLSGLHPVARWPLRLLLIFPFYQATLLMVGTLLGQGRFFWWFSKRLWGRILRRPL